MKLKNIMLRVLLVIAIIIVVIIGITTAYYLLFTNGIIFNGDAEKITKDVLVNVRVYDNNMNDNGRVDGILLDNNTVITVSLGFESPKFTEYKRNGEKHDIILCKKVDGVNIYIYKLYNGEKISRQLSLFPAFAPTKGDVLTIGYYDNGTYKLANANYLGYSHIENKKVYVCDKLADNLEFRPVFNKYGQIVGISRNIPERDYSIIIPYMDIVELAYNL